MRILDIALKDLSQVLRDRKSLLFLLAMPIIFTFFMGFAYRTNDEPADTRLALGWVNNDPGGALSQELHAMLSDSAEVRLVELDAPSAAGLLERGELAGVLSVPPGFSAAAQSGAPAQLSLLADPLTATGQSLYQLLRSPVTRLMGSAQIAAITLDMAAGIQWEAAFAAASQAWAAEAEKGLPLRYEPFAASPSSQPGDPYGGNPYNQASPGILVQFAMFGIITPAQILVMERKARTLQRMMTTAARPVEMLSGHLLAMFVLIFIQVAILVVFGQLVLGVDYLRQPLAVLLISVGLAIWVASMGLFFGSLAKGDEQVILFSMITMFVFSALGGTWFPLEGTGRGFALVGSFTPGAWAMDGYQDLLIRGLGLQAALLPAGMLLLYALGFLLLAVWRFRSSLAQ